MTDERLQEIRKAAERLWKLLTTDKCEHEWASAPGHVPGFSECRKCGEIA